MPFFTLLHLSCLLLVVFSCMCVVTIIFADMKIAFSFSLVQHLNFYMQGLHLKYYLAYSMILVICTKILKTSEHVSSNLTCESVCSQTSAYLYVDISCVNLSLKGNT